VLGEEWGIPVLNLAFFSVASWDGSLLGEDGSSGLLWEALVAVASWDTVLLSEQWGSGSGLLAFV